MDFSINFDTVTSRWSIVYNEGSQGIISIKELREGSGSEVECLTRDQGAAG